MMAKVLILCLNALIGVVLGRTGEMYELDVENSKIIICGRCKDIRVNITLEKFSKCLRDNYHEDTDKMERIRREHNNDLDGCWDEMSKYLDKLHQKHPDGKHHYKAMECFNRHIRDISNLDNCEDYKSILEKNDRAHFP